MVIITIATLGNSNSLMPFISTLECQLILKGNKICLIDISRDGFLTKRYYKSRISIEEFVSGYTIEMTRAESGGSTWILPALELPKNMVENDYLQNNIGINLEEIVYEKIGDFDYVLISCESNFSKLNQEAFRLCCDVIVDIVPETYTLNLLLEFINQLKCFDSKKPYEISWKCNLFDNS